MIIIFTSFGTRFVNRFEMINNDSMRRKHTKLVIVSRNVSNNSWNHCYKWPIANDRSHKPIVNKPFKWPIQSQYRISLMAISISFYRLFVRRQHWSYVCKSVDQILRLWISSHLNWYTKYFPIEIDWAKRNWDNQNKNVSIENANKNKWKEKTWKITMVEIVEIEFTHPCDTCGAFISLLQFDREGPELRIFDGEFACNLKCLIVKIKTH